MGRLAEKQDRDEQGDARQGRQFDEHHWSWFGRELLDGFVASRRLMSKKAQTQ